MAYPRTRMLHVRTGCATGNVVQKSDPVKQGIQPPGNTAHATHPLTCTDLITPRFPPAAGGGDGPLTNSAASAAFRRGQAAEAGCYQMRTSFLAIEPRPAVGHEK